MKNRPLPPLFCEIVFLARRETSILGRISIQRPFPAPFRYQSLPLVRSRSTDRWISFVQIASQSTIIPASFPFHGWKGWTPADFLFRHRKNSGQERPFKRDRLKEEEEKDRRFDATRNYGIAEGATRWMPVWSVILSSSAL